MKYALTLLSLAAGSLLLSGCFHSQTPHPQGYCHHLKTEINSYNHSGLSRAQNGNNVATRSAALRRYNDYGCDD
ncbi:MAG: hypothetical protein COB66_03630 [Coxiella sp. (in: Bacteria)]|nr:MAG: hypothetical protein COB66_03630 [Coxiella sp. (in: g-proteobacteria)]